MWYQKTTLLFDLHQLALNRYVCIVIGMHGTHKSGCFSILNVLHKFFHNDIERNELFLQEMIN